MILAFNNYENPVKAVIDLLKQLKVKITNTSINEIILSHPDYPSLLSLSDSLFEVKVDNMAVRVDKSKLDELPLPFIAYMGRNFKTIMQITTHEVCFLNDNNKLRKQSKDKFIKNWSGVALFAEATESAGEKDYDVKRRKENIKATSIPLLISVGLLWIIISSLLHIEKNFFNAFALIILLVCKLVGIIVTGLLLWYQIDKFNPTLQKICTGNSGNTDCNAVLSSPKAKLFSWVTWSEIGFFYFTGGFLVLTVYPQATNIVAWLNIVTLPYIIFSLYYQKFIVKHWCGLCLAIQCLLLIEFLASYTGGFINLSNVFNTYSVSQIVLLLTLPIAFWYFMQPHFLREQENKTKKYELLRLKNNIQVFETLLFKQKKLAQSADGLGIVIGNPNAENTLIKVCNPYCGPCAIAHKEIEKLLEDNSNLKVQIIFMATNNEADIRTLPVKHFLAIAGSADEAVTKQSLHDWYLNDKKEYDLFARQYPMNGELKMQNSKIEAMNKWNEAVDISFTPTIFINGYQLPELYSIKDLHYLL